jgi:hypothetical protein
MSAHTNAHPLAQGRVHPLPGAVDPPSSEVVMDGLPGREVVGKQAPGTPTTDDVEDGVKDLAQGVYSWSSGGSWERDMRLYVGPFGIG